jgi:hypothetical protein
MIQLSLMASADRIDVYCSMSELQLVILRHASSRPLVRAGVGCTIGKLRNLDATWC